MKKITANLLAMGFGVSLVFGLLFGIETYFRFMYNDTAKFYYTLRPSILYHAACFLRSPMPYKNAMPPRVFCLGGSTTNGNNMPYEYSYPTLLQDICFKEKKPASIYNFGISGVSAVTTNYFIKSVLPQYDPNCVVIHDGYNDLPVVVKKINDNRYEYLAPKDYYQAFNPYPDNPIVRYTVSFIKINFRCTYRFVTSFIKEKMGKGGDLFLGFDYKRYKLNQGSVQDVYMENEKRLQVFLEKELDSIDYCLKHNIKVIVILEPYIVPNFYLKQFGTGFRDENVGEILSQMHKYQHGIYANILQQKYNGNPNVIVLDLRQFFKDSYKTLFYDECHLNGDGNLILAAIVYQAIQRLFPNAK
ncbi:MAG: hypothetical protein MUF05_03680 [Candidatus Omnitrophica bacterium]|nr:hypothetical protein [Candidatus Omnitrophota bacterium]